MTELNEATMKQRLAMLTQPPAAPLKGRGNVRVDFGAVGERAWIDQLPSNPHFALVSVREAVNRFGKIGTPKHLMVSPELANLFN